MKGRQVRYSDEELAFLEWRQCMSRRALHAAFVAHFGRHDVTLKHVVALCTRRGWTTGRTGCFQQGTVPHNKGKPHPVRGRSAETQFKKGQLSGSARARLKSIGAERVTKDGYRERKVNNDLPPQSRWELVHKLEWEAANGPVPDGSVLKCKDGNRLNVDPSNWEPVPRALLPRLGGRYGRDYDGAPAELKPAIMAVAKLEHAARTRRGPEGDSR